METICIQHYDSPCGEMILGSFDGKLCLCDWLIERRRQTIDKKMQKKLRATYRERESGVIAEAISQLNEYFARKRTVFNIPLLFTGTGFQQHVWSELLKIPYGTTISYGKLAVRVGDPKAVRAVANANGQNPISLFVPCHRVIGSNHTLTGYGGGLPAKKFLLELESPAGLAI